MYAGFAVKSLLHITAICMTTILCTPHALAQVGGPSNDTFKAEALHTVCNSPSTAAKADKDLADGICESYFRGLTDGLFLMKTALNHGDAACLPTESPISASEAKGDFELFLRDRPDTAKNSAGLVATFAIMRAHPCSK